MPNEIARLAIEAESNVGNVHGPAFPLRHTGSENRPGSRQDSSDRNRWLIDALLLMCLLAVVAAKSILPDANMNEDLWWHVRTGDWILNHGTVPVQDAYSELASILRSDSRFRVVYEDEIASVFQSAGAAGARKASRD